MKQANETETLRGIISDVLNAKTHLSFNKCEDLTDEIMREIDMEDLVIHWEPRT